MIPKYMLLLLMVLGVIVAGGCADSITESEPSVLDRTQVNAVFRFSDVQAVLNNNCAFSSCHAGTQLPNMSAGQAYANLVNQPSFQGDDYIEPGDPSASYLFRKISGGPNINGVRMPFPGGYLSDTVIDSIGAWISRGAPND